MKNAHRISEPAGREALINIQKFMFDDAIVVTGEKNLIKISLRSKWRRMQAQRFCFRPDNHVNYVNRGFADAAQHNL